MGHAIPKQHPAVVLRSHYNLVRALLVVAMIAVAGLSAAVVIVADDADEIAGTSSASPIGSINYGGFNPATGRPESAPLPQREPRVYGFTPDQAASEALPGSRYDGGPEEGTRGVASPPSSNADADGSAYGQLRRSGALTNGQPTQNAQSDEPPSQAGTKDYSKNGATGDYAHGPLP